MLQDNFQVLAPPGGGGLYLEGRFYGSFLRYEFGGVYIWRGLYMDEPIFGILRYATTISDLITFRGRNGLAKWCGRSRCRFKLKLTWDQALFSFLFLNKIPAGKPKRKESLIQTFHETSSAQLFPNQPIKISSGDSFFSMQIFHTWEKCSLAHLKNSFVSFNFFN